MKKIFYRLSVALFATVMLTGCKDFFDPEGYGSMSNDDYPGSFTELYSGYMGVASSAKLAVEKAIFLEGLRGEFLEPTPHAPQEFYDVYNYVDHLGGSLEGNELADPQPYYNVILNANSFISKAVQYLEDHPGAMDSYSFNGLVGGAIRFKVWAYLNIAKLYGEAIYFDEPLVTLKDLSGYPLWGFDQIIDKCLDLMNNGMYGINGLTVFNWASLLDSSTASASDQSKQDLSRNRECPDPNAMLAELYLWKGNFQMVKQSVFNVIWSGYQRYDSNYARADFLLDERGREGDWDNKYNAYRNYKAVSGFSYSYNLQSYNNLVNYFSNRGENKYYMRPSQYAMDKFTAMTIDPISGSAVGNNHRGDNNTYDEIDGQWVFYKYLSANNTVGTNNHQPVSWINTYTAEECYLFLIEALINLGEFEAAIDIFWNGRGFGQDYIQGFLQNGVFRPGSILEGFPSILAGTRWNNVGGYRHAGIRSHAGVSSSLNVATHILTDPNPDKEVDKVYLDSLFVTEVFYEQSGEGRPMTTMYRIAKRRPELRNAFAKTIAAKYNNGEGSPEIETVLSESIDNWFIKYPLQ